MGSVMARVKRPVCATRTQPPAAPTDCIPPPSHGNPAPPGPAAPGHQIFPTDHTHCLLPYFAPIGSKSFPDHPDLAQARHVATQRFPVSASPMPPRDPRLKARPTRGLHTRHQRQCDSSFFSFSSSSSNSASNPSRTRTNGHPHYRWCRGNGPRNSRNFPAETVISAIRCVEKNRGRWETWSKGTDLLAPKGPGRVAGGASPR